MIAVREVQAGGGYKLALVFSDGSRGMVDFSDQMEKRPYAKIRDPHVFAQAFVEYGHVTWPGDVAVATEFLYARAHKLPPADTFEQAKANEFEMSLRQLRDLAGLSQSEVAPLLEMSQGSLSRFETREDRLVSNLRKYVEALGGRLELVAVLGDKRIKLNGV